jgi:hypothetical protein
MSAIKANDIFKIEDPSLYKFHAARSNHVEEPLDVFVRSRSDWRKWNTWRNDRNEFNRRFIFSLIDNYHECDSWLFGGIFEVIARGERTNSHSYKIKEVEDFQPYVGRLKIGLERPARGRAFYLERHLDKMEISEILHLPYSGEAFPGYEHINHDFSTLQEVFRSEKADWKASLMNVKGVYVISDKSNGKNYVGSAVGEFGLWSRWSSYLGTGHGGNDELLKLIQQMGFDYAVENFRLSLLEYRPMKTDDHLVRERETFWKKVFLSIGEFGYNKN